MLQRPWLSYQAVVYVFSKYTLFEFARWKSQETEKPVRVVLRSQSCIGWCSTTWPKHWIFDSRSTQPTVHVQPRISDVQASVGLSSVFDVMFRGMTSQTDSKLLQVMPKSRLSVRTESLRLSYSVKSVSPLHVINLQRQPQNMKNRSKDILTIKG